MTIRIYDQSAREAGDTRHGADIVRALGIQFDEYRCPPNLGDCWLFYGVRPESVPVNLPSYVEIVGGEP